ncbi:hypothetical protein LPB140_10770 [Sphingorhabdus lutea]|uniref:CBS domain-containing protein n=1 Tax=Sphingorhabdus lutea TaxID=1913578 RepID=A0A1L3JDH3_9SPHN|nr:CBS domain-containing protein [Sphingorhabdus lutea]APG63191.1 hypothetical protein LPB140_10770 [Sphingorhabdus lutea]
MTISAIIENRQGGVISAAPDDNVAKVAQILADKRIGALPIIQNDDVVGIFSERDLVYGIAQNGAKMMEMKVGDVMTAPAISISSDTLILSALSLMTKRRIRHLPVVDNGRLISFVSIGDLVKYRIDKIEAEAAAMRDYIQMA